MAKENKSKYIVIGIIAVLILAIFMSSGSLFSTTGFSTLSLSPVDFMSNDADVNGKAFLVNIVADSSGESLSGKLNTFNLEGQQTTKTLDVSLINTVQQCEYPILNKYDFVKNYEFKEYSYTPFSCESTCFDAGGEYYMKPSGSLTCFCLIPRLVGVIGSIGDDTLKFTSTFKVQNDLISEQKELTNLGGYSSAYIDAEKRVFVKWTGNLATGSGCPDPVRNNVATVYNYANKGWGIVDMTKANNNRVVQLNIKSCFYDSQVIGYTNAKTKITDCLAGYNSDVTKLMSIRQFTTSGGVAETVSGDVESGKIILKLPYSIQFPTFQMKVKADLLGVTVPVGMPKINQISSTEFSTGSKGSIFVQVRNAGSAQSNFEIFASCNNGFKQELTSTRETLGVNEIKNYYLSITGATVDDFTTGICSVTVKDLNSMNSDTKTVSVKVTSLKFCTPNAFSCDSIAKDKIQCTSAGNGWVIVEKQSKECGYVPPTCTGSDCPPVVPEFNWTIFIIASIIGLFVGGLAYGYSSGMELIRTGNEFVDKLMKVLRWVLIIGAVMFVTVLMATLIKGGIGVFSI